MTREHIETFLHDYPDYANDINNFLEYLTTEANLDIDNEITVRGMASKTIIDSLKYFTIERTFKTKSTAEKYCISIQQLLLKLFGISEDYKNTDLENEFNAQPTSEKSYRKQYMDFINNSDLSEKESISALNENDAEKLLKECNKYIITFLLNSFKGSTRIAFRDMVSSLAIKLMLATGIKYGVLRSISIDDFNIDDGIISINGYKMLLPLNLTSQLKSYKSYLLKNERDFEKTPGHLFVSFKGEQLHEKTGVFFEKVAGQKDTTSITKYGIRGLLSAGISDRVVMEITGAGPDILLDCCEQVIEEEFSYLNSKILTTPFYKMDSNK